MLKPSQITESVSDLKNMMRKTSLSYKKKRLKALYLFCSDKGLNRKEIAAKIGVDRKTVGHWFQTYESGGLQALLARDIPQGVQLNLPKNNKKYCLLNSKNLMGFPVISR